MEKNENSEKEIKKGKAGHFSKKTGLPSKFNIDDFLKANKVLHDKGGTATIKDLTPLFGHTKKEILARALKFGSEIGFAKRHGFSYTITEEGKTFTHDNEESKRLLAGKLMKYEKYKDIFITLNNDKSKTMKKSDITQIWPTGALAIRKYATKTFASLCNWAGVVYDTGYSCKLKTEVFTSERETPTMEDKKEILGSADLKLRCPVCESNEIALLREDPVKFIERGNNTIVFMKNEYLCKRCRKEFSRTDRQLIPLDT